MESELTETHSEDKSSPEEKAEKKECTCWAFVRKWVSSMYIIGTYSGKDIDRVDKELFDERNAGSSSHLRV